MKIEGLFNIREKVFLVTGAYGLIGKHVCKFLVDNDVIVIAVGRREERLKDLKNELKNITIFKMDISNESGVISLYENLTKKIKKIDVLVNIAAKSTSNTFENLMAK